MAEGRGNSSESHEFCFSSDLSLEEVRSIQHQFCRNRNWGQFHSPRNVLLALVGEVGELAEIFQWRGEVQKGLPEMSAGEKHHVGEELSDILLYLVDLAQQCHVDLPSAVMEKLSANGDKYPVHKVHGRSEKYNVYVEEQNGAEDPHPGGGKVQEVSRREREEGDGSEGV